MLGSFALPIALLCSALTASFVAGAPRPSAAAAVSYPPPRERLAFVAPLLRFALYRHRSGIVARKRRPRVPAAASSVAGGGASSSPLSSERSRLSKRKGRQRRNRGANAASRNRRGHSFRLNDDGTRRRHRKSNSKRAPRWEREGDYLYAEVSRHLDVGKGNHGVNFEGPGEIPLALANRPIRTVQDVHRLLAPWTAAAGESDGTSGETDGENDGGTQDGEDEVYEPEESKSPPFLWGSLPVGPVLASRLRASGRTGPTSVQRAAFPVLTISYGKENKRTNAIIASPTGTGKTLAYLLPLLCTSPGGRRAEGAGGVLIVTPTIELACQIRREADALWPPDPDLSSLFVVGVDDLTGSGHDGDDKSDRETARGDAIVPGRTALRLIRNTPLIAGTPKMLRSLYREAERVANDPENGAFEASEEERATSKALLSNLRAIVLDEADRLLRTEAVARETVERRRRKEERHRAEEAEADAPGCRTPSPAPRKKRRLVISRPTQAELLLRDIPVPSLNDVQIVCASATIGRTMRRQLMGILDAPSADAAAVLVTGDGDIRAKSKDRGRRRGALLPGGLRHAYCVVEEGRELMGAELEEDGMSTAKQNEAKRARDTIDALWEVMNSTEDVQPAIVFPGRLGVDRVRRELLARGLNDVRTLRNLDGKSPETGDGGLHAGRPTASIGRLPAAGRASVPVYVIGERFARGLDLPDVGRVFLLSPPSSAAGYVHMAGRTGRIGRAGTAVTLVGTAGGGARRLAAIAAVLGLQFDAPLVGAAGDPYRRSSGVRGGLAAPGPVSTDPWGHLSESALRRKRNAELREYLVDNGCTVNEGSRKEDLVSAVRSLHPRGGGGEIDVT